MKEKVFQRYKDYQGYMEEFGLEEEEGLEQEKKDIENRRFVVMIVGEAKSGKSSFIDAYLQTNVLPIDVKQCTNALIHIRHSEDRKSTRLNSSHANISYAVFCLK